ncbi:hypothetical protein [Bathymodiolus thermophilus thioautotrophic gill symbiont]|uniref:Uncharacterized protein n=1 Tax=Bathymodiolus thermophilus thioautotrophic gill symbiont TaxID=2360 RepID=A0A3G3IKW0_9GAMM|nr:hypothetical protein [Bathymodiolus thermophilus thioautotrophic gill symbiont]AYQ56122.1 hypothetical protein MS2017_0376 [Bathymodiolus thermophilus thioautotrophic gill symbiont]CAB5502141.1 hypothetical protein THERMOS_1532 [Bathymodiolus thermophilus thioautotrophic gill symbiont]
MKTTISLDEMKNVRGGSGDINVLIFLGAMLIFIPMVGVALSIAGLVKAVVS